MKLNTAIRPSRPPRSAPHLIGPRQSDRRVHLSRTKSAGFLSRGAGSSTNHRGAAAVSKIWQFFCIRIFLVSDGPNALVRGTSTNRASVVLTVVPYRVKYRVKLRGNERGSELEGLFTGVYNGLHPAWHPFRAVWVRVTYPRVSMPLVPTPFPVGRFDLDRHHLHTTRSASGLHLIHRRVGFRITPAPGRMENTKYALGLPYCGG